MTRPWLKANPFLSAWLSGANQILNGTRAHYAAASRRQNAALMAATFDAWARAWTPPAIPAAKTRRRARRRK